MITDEIKDEPMSDEHNRRICKRCLTLIESIDALPDCKCGAVRRSCAEPPTSRRQDNEAEGTDEQ